LLIPPAQVLVETDAPFLTPHPYRGAANEPYCLPYTVRALSELTGRSAEELAHDSSANARRVYGLAEAGGCPGHGPGPQEG
jgi:TatD DNase family protein